MMRKLFVALFAILCFNATKAQSRSAQGSSYTTALGVKLFDGAGITLKHFIANDRAIEGIGYFGRNGFRLTGLYEIHGDLDITEGLKWYFGPGAHLGFYNSRYYNSGVVIGIDGVLGLDYKFSGAPINMSIDWQPSFEFARGLGFSGGWGGLGIRYTF